MNVVFFGFKHTGLAFLDNKQADGLKNAEVKALDILLNITGASIGRVTLAPKSLEGARVNQHVCIIRPNEALEPRFLNAYFSSPAMQSRIWADNYGVTRQALTKQQILDFEIPLAPLPEQKRIADKLDATLARVDVCRERLARVAPILKRFRQSVLAAAVSGRLTADWRAQQAGGDNIPLTKESPAHPAVIEPASGHQAQTRSPDAMQWQSCKISEAGRVQLGRQRSPKFHSGKNMRPYLRVQNVFEDRLDLSDIMEMDFPGEDYDRYRLHVGDILLNEGQSPQFLGRPAMYKGEPPDCCFTNTLIRFQAYPHVKPEFALLVFRHQMHSGRYIEEGTITTNIAHLGAGRFSNVEFPLPPIAEQHEIVRRVESLFAFADRLEARLAAAQTATEQLTPALLAKAFRGELVPQDPADEPASELLQRLAASRTSAAKPKRPRTPRQPA